MKGILLAGGRGTRLHPITLAVSKQLVPIYDKPLIYYSLSTLMLAAVREVMIVTTPEDQRQFRALLGDGSQLGMRFHYVAQRSPDGIAQAFLLDRDFLDGERVALVLGDTFLYAEQLPKTLRRAVESPAGATVFASRVSDPERYGVVTFDGDDRPVAVEEKPARPTSNWAVTGVYFYDERACEFAASLEPSARGELEITDLNRVYLARGELVVERLGRGTTWFDSGTPDAMLRAANFVQALEERQGLKIACIEEIAWRMGWISIDELARLGHAQRNSAYGQYIARLCDEGG
ncbi:MAG: glucose-1-phosphate thymidylyltransferase RfbA [Polyangiales bacterium]